MLHYVSSQFCKTNHLKNYFSGRTLWNTNEHRKSNEDTCVHQFTFRREIPRWREDPPQRRVLRPIQEVTREGWLQRNENQNKVLISLRNNKKLIGRVKAFDGYLNMVLEGVKEMWTEVGKDGGKSVSRDRFIGKMFLRGDNIILVLRRPSSTTISKPK